MIVNDPIQPVIDTFIYKAIVRPAFLYKKQNFKDLFAEIGVDYQNLLKLFPVGYIYGLKIHVWCEFVQNWTRWFLRWRWVVHENGHTNIK